MTPITWHDYALVTLPRVLADLITGPEPEPYRLVRPLVPLTVPDVEQWLLRAHPFGWKEDGVQGRREAAKRLLFAVWLRRTGRVSDEH